VKAFGSGIVPDRDTYRAEACDRRENARPIWDSRTVAAAACVVMSQDRERLD